MMDLLSVCARLVACIGVALMSSGISSPVAAISQTILPENQISKRPVVKLQEVLQRKSVINLTVKDGTIESAIQQIAAQADMLVFYSNRTIELSKKITININDVSLMQALVMVSKASGLDVRISPNGETIMVRSLASVAAIDTQYQVQRVTGIVIDSAKGKPVVGASVTIQGTSLATVTGERGEFAFKAIPVGEHVFVLRSFGYRSVSQRVQITGTTTSVVFKVSATATQLSGVVTTATGMQRKIEVGNDITTIKVDEVIRNNPVSNVSELLATRVPGLHAVPVSGQPGAPTRLRIRGVSSINTSNEPIIVVDGVQIRSEAKNMRTGDDFTFDFAFSPLDQIDVNAIEKVEVLKGPSAVALYGSDAANGVIVITTKRGEVGPARWMASGQWGTQTMPGQWPQNYYSWGTQRIGGTGLPRHCPSTLWVNYSGCRPDSMTVYQLMNDRETTVFGRGLTQDYSVGVNGGVRGMTYSFTASLGNVLGLMKLPAADLRQLEAEGQATTPWQRRPQASNDASGTAQVRAEVGRKSDLTLTTTLSRKFARSTPLSEAMSTAATFSPVLPTYGADGEIVISSSQLLEKINVFRERREGAEIGARNALVANSRVIPGLNTMASLGFDLRKISSRAELLNGDCYGQLCATTGVVSTDSGYAKRRNGTAITSDMKLMFSGAPIGSRWLNVVPSFGGNFVMNRESDAQINIIGLPVGSVQPSNVSRQIYTEYSLDRNTLGMYVETRVKIADRFWFPLSVRTDAGSALGGSVTPRFPRLGFSYLLSDQPAFQKLPGIGALPLVRIRTAFGVAGKQPGVAEKYRTYSQNSLQNQGLVGAGFGIKTIGNTRLRPERSSEWELGLDTDIFEGDRGRLTIAATYANKHTKDLVTAHQLPGSLSGHMQTINLGNVSNTSAELTIDGTIHSNMLTWIPSVTITKSRNRVESLSPTALRASTNYFGFELQTRNVVGYPLNGRWAQAIVGYSDDNLDGIIEADEVQRSDSAAYIGAPYPKFTLNTQQQITFLKNITVTGVFAYDYGSTQIREVGLYSRVENDPSLSLREQAYGRYSVLSRVQEISSLRFTSVQLTYLLPRNVSGRVFGGRSVSMSMAGKNVALWTTYRGKDPNVGAFAEELHDQGQLPTPRTWTFALRVH